MPNPLDELRAINREERDRLTKPMALKNAKTQMSETSITQKLIRSNAEEDIPPVRLNFDVPGELHSELKQYCAKHRILIRKFLLDLITDAIGGQGK